MIKSKIRRKLKEKHCLPTRGSFDIFLKLYEYVPKLSKIEDTNK
jgi:hypothetical protein